MKDATEADLVARNEAAAEVMARHGVTINDLHAAMLPHLAEYQNPKDVHFGEPGYRFLADRVADSILKAVPHLTTINTALIPLSKLERDALLGQAMDFEMRGHVDDAIGCYQRAIRGGLRLPAAYFMLGLLYANNKQMTEAKKVLAMAAKNPLYLQASKLAINGR